MSKKTAIAAIHDIGRLVFTTREISSLTGSSMTTTTQCLKRLEEKKIIKKINHGIWGFVGDRRFSPFMVIPFLNPRHQSYLSFISALHIHGVISQIPQIITVASTAHTKVRNTTIGSYHIHQISPDFFFGFDWHGSFDFLIASPEKAFVDCLYLAARKKRQFAAFPELDLKHINMKEVRRIAGRIKDPLMRRSVTEKLKTLE